MVAIRHESEYKDNHGVKLTAVHNLEVARAAGCFQQLGQPFSVKADHCEDLPVEWAAGARHRPNAGATECGTGASVLGVLDPSVPGLDTPLPCRRAA